MTPVRPWVRAACARFDTVPLLTGALALVSGNVPGGGRTNAEHFGPALELERAIATDLLQLLHDPQTSGGLLAAIDRGHGQAARAAFAAAGVSAWEIGAVLGIRDKSVSLR